MTLQRFTRAGIGALLCLLFVSPILSSCVRIVSLDELEGGAGMDPGGEYGELEYPAEEPPPLDLEEDGFILEDVELDLDAPSEVELDEVLNVSDADPADAAAVLRDLSDEELIVYALLLESREAAGLPDLDLDGRLVEAAREHSTDMAAVGECTHEGSDGSQPSERIEAAGYLGNASGENVLCGMVTPDRAVEMWMGSPPHRANILSERFEHVGVGVDSETPGGPTWTLTFGAGD